MVLFTSSRCIRLIRSGLLAIGMASLLAAPALADSSGPLTGGTIVKMPGIPTSSAPAWSADISWVDGSGTYYLADRTLKGIDVVDTNNNYVKTITGGFVGPKLRKNGTVDNDHSGPDGLVVIDSRREAWAGDGDSTVKVVDLNAGTVVASISTGGTARADELAYDSKDGIVVIANDADDPPFLTFISVPNRMVLGKIPYPDATDGLEQPQFIAANGMFYQAVPATKQNPGGQIDVIDPKAMKVAASYPVQNCVPHGLTVGPNQQLLLGCNSLKQHAQQQVMDATNGNILAVITDIGGTDEVWYDSGTNRYYVAGSSMTSDGTKTGKPAPTLGVIDAGTYQYLGGVSTVPGTHSVAADPKTGRVIVPVPTKGLTVFTPTPLAKGQSISSSITGSSGGATANSYVKGDGSDWTLTLSVSGPVDPGVSSRVGLAVWSSASTLPVFNGSLGLNRTSLTATVPASTAGATYTVQVFDYQPGFRLNYTLTAS